MQNLNCNSNLKALMRSVITYQNREQVVAYLNALTYVPDWDEFLWAFPELRRKYSQSLIALNKELVPNHVSHQDVYSKLWELFKDIAVNANNYLNNTVLKQKLSEFYADIKKPLISYEIIYEIRHFDVGEEIFTFGKAKMFKLNTEYFIKEGLIKDISIIKDTIFNEWLGKSVVKTEVNIANLDRAYETGLSIVKDVLDTVRLIAVWGRIDRPNDEYFLWEIGRSLTIPKVAQYDSRGVGTTYHRGFRPSVNNMSGAISRTLYEQNTFSHLFDDSLPKDIYTRLSRAIKWMSQAIITNGLDFKIIYLITSLEIMLLPGRKSGTKGEPLALRQVLLGHGNSYVPETILYLYEKRSNIIHDGALDITSYSAYWNLLICCFEVLRRIIKLSKLNPSILKLADLLKTIETPDTLRDFIHCCEMGIYNGKGINKIKIAAEARLKEIERGANAR